MKHKIDTSNVKPIKEHLRRFLFWQQKEIVGQVLELLDMDEFPHAKVSGRWKSSANKEKRQMSMNCGRRKTTKFGNCERLLSIGIIKNMLDSLNGSKMFYCT